MVHFDHSAAYEAAANHLSQGWPGFVDFEDGIVDSGETKPAFPTKGIYPNKNTEKSKMFYGVRGVRQTKSLYQNRVDERFPRVLLNRTMIHHNYVDVIKGIIYLATVDNYDKVEWYRTLDCGKTWQLLIGVRGDLSDYTRSYYIGDGYGWGSVTDYKAALGEFYTPLGMNCGCGAGDQELGRHTYLSDIVTGVSPIVWDSYFVAPSFVDDDRNPHLRLLQWGSLPANITIGGYIYKGSEGYYANYREAGDSPSSADYGIHVDRVGIKCRVYKGAVWAESDIIYANGTIEKNPNPKLTPPVISVWFAPYQRIPAVKELKPPAVNLSLETDTTYAVTEVIAPLSLSLDLDSPQVVRAVKEPRPPLISLEVEAVEGTTRTEGHRTQPEISVSYSTVADVKTVSEAILPKPSIIGVECGRTEQVTKYDIAPTPQISYELGRTEEVKPVTVVVMPKPSIIGVECGRTEQIVRTDVLA